MRTICLKFKSCLAFSRLGFKHPVLPNLCISIHHLDTTSPWEISIALPKQLDLGTKPSVLEHSPGNFCFVVKCLSTSRVRDILQLCSFKYLRLSRCQKIELKPNPFLRLFLLSSPRELHRLSWNCGFQRSDGASICLCNLAVAALPQCKIYSSSTSTVLRQKSQVQEYMGQAGNKYWLFEFFCLVVFFKIIFKMFFLLDIVSSFQIWTTQKQSRIYMKIVKGFWRLADWKNFRIL